MTSKPISILLVEDNIPDAILMMETLRDIGAEAEIYHVSDGIEALDFLRRSMDRDGISTELAKRFPTKVSPIVGPTDVGIAEQTTMRPDIVLLDLNLPKMDGRELLSIIKSDRSLRTIPVIVLSTSTAERDVEFAYENYANCYLKKPVDLVSFTRTAMAIQFFWLNHVIFPH